MSSRSLIEPSGDSIDRIELLNGVIVRISENYKPPPRITIENIRKILDDECLDNDFDFTFERQVLRDCQEEPEPSCGGVDELDCRALESNRNGESGKASVSCEQGASSPSFPYMRGEILVPKKTPSPNSDKLCESNDGGGTKDTNGGKNHAVNSSAGQGFRVEDFEYGQDPFDSLELQTLDERNELKKILTYPSAPNF